MTAACTRRPHWPAEPRPPEGWLGEGCDDDGHLPTVSHLDDELLFPCLGVPDQRSVGEASPRCLIHHVNNSARDTPPEAPPAEAEEDIRTLGCRGAGCLHGEPGSSMKLPGEQLRRCLCEHPWAVTEDPVSLDVVVADGKPGSRSANFGIVELSTHEPLNGPRGLHAAEAMCYFVLLLRSSVNLGSGVSGGRCGLTTTLNQASC